MMTQFQVLLHVPEQLVTGLKTGTLERVGGVIRDSQTKQVVAWLRDMGANTDGQLSESVQQVVVASHHTVGNFPTWLLNSGLLSFSLTAISLWGMSKRIDGLSSQIDNLRETVRTEFKRDRDMRFKVAIQAARDAFESDQQGITDNAARSALDGLFEARQTFLDDFTTLTCAERPTADQRLLAHQYLLRAMYAETSRIRCYLHQSIELAHKRILEDLPRFRECVVTLVNLWLGDKQAAYFHRQMTLDQVRQYIVIKRWLSAPDDPTSVEPNEHLIGLIDSVRSDFWIQDIGNNFEGRRFPWERPNNTVNILAEQLTYAEIVIENFRHLEGFALELRTLRLLNVDWRTVISNDSLAEADIALVLVQSETE
jgi:hypothetical protein